VHGASFDEPTVDALDKTKQAVDAELHFHDLPAELRGLHDQVCTLMLSKADGTLEHHGDRSAVKRPDPASAATEAAVPAPAPPASSGIQDGLRGALAAYLEETAEAVRGGAPVADLHARLAKLDKLVSVVADFDG